MADATDKILKQFTEYADLHAFAKAQQKTITELTKKNKQLNEEVKHLKKLLDSTVPVINPNKSPLIELASNDEESIAREQLWRLKDISKERELTLEETKRVEIYSKILMAIKETPKPIEVRKNISDAELIAALNQVKPNDEH